MTSSDTVQSNVQTDIQSVPGFKIAGIDAGIRKKAAPDLTLLVADHACTAAGVFTTNHVKAAPVLLDMARLDENPTYIRAVLINAACANACTGDVGLANAERTATLTAQALGCQPSQVLVMSTGVIGVQLPMEKFEAGIPRVVAAIKPDGWHEASQAIMTTDTRPKRAAVTVNRITIAGIAKGAGMIAPNMATLLSVIATDASIPAPLLHTAIRSAADASFNRVVVDGDMSTNDTLLILASGASGIAVTEANLAEFTAALTEVCTALAKEVVRDGEGATKFITLNVVGGRTSAEAKQIGNAIATSALTKTAFYGGDANWGRIVAAAGRAGVEIDQRKLSLWYDDLQLVQNGLPLDYDETRANQIAASAEINVRLDLGLGDADAIIWTCDLSHDYVDINGHYRT